MKLVQIYHFDVKCNMFILFSTFLGFFNIHFYQDHIPSEIGNQRHSSFHLVEDKSVNQSKSISKRYA